MSVLKEAVVEAETSKWAASSVVQGTFRATVPIFQAVLAVEDFVLAER